VDEFLSGALWGGLFGGIGGGLFVLVWGLLIPPKSCPKCGTKIPRFRKPANLRQALWGGYTCQKCGTVLDRKGKRIEP